VLLAFDSFLFATLFLSLESHEPLVLPTTFWTLNVLFGERLVTNLLDLLLLRRTSVCFLRIEMTSETGRVRRSLSLARKRAQTLQEKIGSNDDEVTYR